MSQGQQGRCPSQVAQQARKSFLLSRPGKHWAGATLARATSRLLAQKEILTRCVTRSRPHWSLTKSANYAQRERPLSRGF